MVAAINFCIFLRFQPKNLILELRQLFPTYEQAYEELEAQHERITGKWMYAEYDTFRRVYKRWLKKEKRSPK